MANPPVSPERLRALAELVGLQIDAERLHILQPGCERLLNGIESLAALDLEGEEPAIIFLPKRE